MKTILLFLILFISCSKEKVADSYVNEVINQSEADVLNNFFYGFQQVSFFQNLPITPLTPNIAGKKPIIFSTNPQLPKGLSIDPTTGVISGVPTELSLPAIYTVYAENSVGRVNISISLSIVNPPPTNLSISPIDNTFIRGFPIDSHVISVKGDVDYFTINPSLPNGLIFDAITGQVSGVPTVVQSKKSYIVKAFNQAGESNSFTISIKIIDQAPIGLTYGSASVSYKVNESIQPLLPTNTGGVITFYSISPSLPAGLFLDVQSGRIFGTPLVEQFPSVNHIITGFNTGGEVLSSLNIEVTDIPVISINYPENLSFTSNTEIESINPSYVGGKPTNYTIDKPLPSGLFLNDKTGRISGTPLTLNVLGEDFTITASNSQNTILSTLNIKIVDKPPLDITTNKEAYSFRIGESNSIKFNGNAGGTVVRYDVTPPLPDGLSINDSVGAIQGIAIQESEEKTYIISAINSGGKFDFSLKLSVDAQPDYSVETSLTAKSSSDDKITYNFNLKNKTTLLGSGTFIPFIEMSIDTFFNPIIELESSSSCLNLDLLDFNGICNISVSIPKNIIINNYLARIKLGNFYSFDLDLSFFSDLKPKNVIISSDRLLSKAIFQDVTAKPLLTSTFFPVDLEREFITSFNTQMNNKVYSSSNPVSNIINSSNELSNLNSDPDLDGITGLVNYENFNFNFNVKSNFDVIDGIDYACEIVPPYIESCEIPSFQMLSSELASKSNISISIKPIQGDVNESVISNEIPVNNYKITKIWNTINTSEDLFLYKNFLYFGAPLDKITTNTRKLMKLDLTSDILSLSSKFTSNGDDRAFIVGELSDNILLMKAKNHESVDNYMTLFVYDLNDKDIYPFSLNDSNFKFNFLNESDNYTYFYTQGNFSYFFAKDSQNQYVIYEFNRVNTSLKKIVLPLSDLIYDSNGKPDFSSVIINNNNIIFNANLKSATGEYKKLVHYRFSDNTLRKVVNINGDNISDNISNINNINSMIYFLSVNSNNHCQLISYNMDSLDSRILKESNKSECSGTKIIDNSLFFIMNDTTKSLFKYDFSTGEITKKFSTINPQDKITLVNRNFNMDNELFFNVYDSEKESYSLYFYDINEDKINNISNDNRFYSSLSINFNNSYPDYVGVNILPSYLGLTNVAYMSGQSYIERRFNVKKNTDYSLSFFAKFETGFGQIKILNDDDEVLYSFSESDITNNFLNIKTVNFGVNENVKIIINADDKNFYIDNINILDNSLNYIEIIKGMDMSVFKFNSQYFFNCGINNVNLCVYDKRTEQNALIVRNLNFEISSSLKGIVQYGNKLYFSTKKTDNKDAGLYVLTIE